jgi:hypothetical protein
MKSYLDSGMSLLGVRGGQKYLLVDILDAVDINLSDVIGFGVAWWWLIVRMSEVKIRHSYFSSGKIRVLRLSARGASHIVVSLPSESTISEFNQQEQTQRQKKFQLFHFVYQFQKTGQNNISATYHFSSIALVRPRAPIKSQRRTKHGIQAKDIGPGKSIACQQSMYFMLIRVDRRST